MVSRDFWNQDSPTGGTKGIWDSTITSTDYQTLVASNNNTINSSSDTDTGWITIKNDKIVNKEIKYNNKILHQSKLVNYFNGDYAKSKIEEDLDKFLKKIKKDKKYFLSKKDIIFLEALKSDGIKISKKYENLYEVNKSEMPRDIQEMIDNEEIGAALLRIVEVIGPEKIEDIDDDTVYFIISTLNQLNAGLIRNRLLLKVLPLKV